MAASVTVCLSHVSVMQIKHGLTIALKMRRVCILHIRERMLMRTMDIGVSQDISFRQKSISALSSPSGLGEH
jgi:hypothetical protein